MNVPPDFTTLLLSGLRGPLRQLRRQRQAAVGGLLALLALLGGAAFQMRNGGGLSPQLYAAMQAQSASDHAGHTGHVGHAAPTQAPVSGSGKHASHDPKAHCGFCVTQAFGTEDLPLDLLAPAPDSLPTAIRLRPTAAQSWPRWTDARAPPENS